MKSRKKKRTSIAKKCLYSFIALMLCLLLLEIAARVDACFRYGRTGFWLSYGFVTQGPAHTAQEDDAAAARLTAAETPPRSSGGEEVPVAEMDPDTHTVLIVHPDGTRERRHSQDLIDPDAPPLVNRDEKATGYYLCSEGRKAYINSHGLRGPEFPQRKPRGAYRIVVLGGSVVWGDRNDDAHTHPALLEKTLHTNGFTHVHVINAGWPGYDSGCFLRLADKIASFEPDLVVVFDAWNDIMRVMQEVVPKETYLAVGVLRFLVERSVLALRMAESLRSVGAKPGGSSSVTVEQLESLSSEEHPVFRELKDNLSQLIERFQSERVPLLLVRFPNNIARLHLERPSFAAGMRRATSTTYTITGKLARRFSLPVCDCESAFQATGKAELFIDNVDPMHLTDRGNAHVAELLSECIRTNFDLRGPRSQ